MSEESGKQRLFYGWYILTSGFLALVLGFGIRQTFGLFFKPIQQEFELSRTALSLVVSLTLIIYGVVQPFFGNLLDRYGPKVVFAFSGAILSIGLVLMGLVTAPWQLYVIYGLVLGAGFGGVAFVTVLSMVSRWFVRRQGLVLGMATTGASVGQFVMVPFAAILLFQFGWRYTQILMGILVLAIILPLSLWVMKKDPSAVGCDPDGQPLLSESNPSREEKKRWVLPSTTPAAAFCTQSFWILTVGFFVCGFTGTMVSTHLVPYATDVGYSTMTAAIALALVGGLNFFSILALGGASDLVGRRIPLAVVYTTRGLSYLFLMVTDQVWGLYLFAVIFGLSYMATVPLTLALVTELFGPAYVGTIFGVITLSHQLGGALGVFLGGLSFDLTGSYNYAFLLALVAGVVAGILSYLVEEREPAPIPSEASTREVVVRASQEG